MLPFRVHCEIKMMMGYFLGEIQKDDLLLTLIVAKPLKFFRIILMFKKPRKRRDSIIEQSNYFLSSDFAAETIL